MPARGPTRRRPRHHRRTDRLRVESLTERTVPSASLLLATESDNGGGTPGTTAWTAGTVVRFGDPNFGLEPGGTTGTFAPLTNLDQLGDGDVKVSAVHFVRRQVTVGTGPGAVTLLPGDLLLSTADDETLISLNTLSVTKDEVFVFRPAAPGDYSAGTFRLLLDNFAALHGGGQTLAVALVERDTLVGGVTLTAGSFLFARAGGTGDNDVWWFIPTGVGPGATSGTVVRLLEGDEVGVTAPVYGLELVETPTLAGGRALPAGTLLLAVHDDGTVGNNALAVQSADVFALTVTQTTLGSGTGLATASLVFRGGAVGLGGEKLHGVTLTPGAPPTASSDAYSTRQGVTLTVPAPGVLGNDTDPDGDPLTARLLTGPAHGTLMLRADGSFTYVPAPGYAGPDSFVYEVDDGSGGTAAGVVTLVVQTNRLVVDTTADTADGNVTSILALIADKGPDGRVSLREAILAANNTPNLVGPDQIAFAIPGGGPFVILLASELPDITDAVVIDGTTQPGFAGSPVVELDGSAAGPGARGLHLAASSSGTTIRGLVITGFGGPGILVDGSTRVVIGGTQAGQGNVITNNGGGGVVVQTGSARIVRNSIDGNGGLGIDLGGDGVTPNDNDDPDAGPNGLQNYPDLTGATVTGGTLTVTGSLKSSRSTTFVVDFYGSPAAGASGYGEGAVYLGSTTVVTTNGGGNRSFTAGLSTTVPAGWVVTATATDAAGNTSEFSAAVPVSGPPVAVNDAYSALEDRTLIVPAASGLLANDTDPGDGALTAALQTGPARGTVTVSPDGSFSYTPAANFYGTETFTYTVRDSSGLTDVGTVTIVVTPVNDPPSFTLPGNPPVVNEDASPQTVTGFATNISVEPSPGPGGGGGTPQTLTFLVTGNSNVGLFSAGPAISPSGTLTYTLAPNAFGTATVTVVAQDSGGTANGGQDTSASRSFVITVRPVNDPPALDPIADQTVAEDAGPRSVPLTGISAGPGESQPLRVTAVSNNPTLVPNPTVSYTSPAATGTLRYQSAANASGSAVVTVTVREPGTDGQFGTADDRSVSRQFRITVTPANDPPVANPDAYAAVVSLTVPAAAGVLANDTDLDGDALTAFLVGQPAHGTVTLNPNGSFTYIPDPVYFGPDAFTYQAQDPSGALSGVTTVTINVTLPNRPPVAADDSATTAEDTPLNGSSVLANDVDPNGDPLTAQLVSGPTHGTVTLNPNGSFTYVPTANYNGPDSFTYRASDGQGNSAPATVRITVNPVNDAPSAAADLYTTGQNRPLTVPAAGVLANDTDVEGDPLTAALVSGPANGTLTLNADGSFTYTPNPAFRGTDTFTYRATDPGGASSTATVTLRVVPPSGRPVAQDDGYTVAEDGRLSVPAPGVLANDTPPGFLPLTARVVSGPLYGTLTFNRDGSFAYTPNPDFFGTDSFTYRAVDINGGASAPARVTLTVTPTPDPPVAAADQFTAEPDTTLTVPGPGILANDADPDGDPLTAGLVSGPASGTLTLNPDGSFTYTPAAGFSGDDSFAYQVTDGQFTSSPVPVTIMVRPTVPPPDPEPEPEPPPQPPPPPPVVPPPSGGGGGPVDPGPGPSPTPGGSTPTPTEPILPVPPTVGGGPPAFGGPGLSSYVAAAPAPFAPRAEAQAPSVVIPSLPLPPSVPILPPPIRVDGRPAPATVTPPAVVPETPGVAPVPQLQPENPVFGGLDDLAKDVGQGKKVQTVTGTVVGTGVVATAGYVLLSPRLAYWFLSALLARRTVWKPFDPVEVLYAWERDKGSGGEDDDSLKDMLDSEPAKPGQ